MKGQKVLFSRKSDEWATPDDLFQKLDNEFQFTVDAAATKENTKCKYYFDSERDGLEQDWGNEVVFVNPPYSQISKWVEKAAHESGMWDTERNCTVVMLLPARTDTRWFHDYIYNKRRCEVRFLKGRLKFKGADNSAPFPSMVVIFR